MTHDNYELPGKRRSYFCILDIKIDFLLPSYGVYFRCILEVLELVILSIF